MSDTGTRRSMSLQQLMMAAGASADASYPPEVLHPGPAGPVITALVPDRGPEGSTLTVIGTGFTAEHFVTWRHSGGGLWSATPTSFSPTELQGIVVPQGSQANWPPPPQDVSVTVTDAMGNDLSNAMTFSISVFVADEPLAESALEASDE